MALPTPSESTCDHPGHESQYWLKPDLARRHLAACPWCGELYNVGPHTGELLLVYPEAASRFWQHGSSPRHQHVMAALAAHQHDILDSLDTTISAARIAQKELQDPTRQGLKRLLA